jgi:hypothetical protein
MSGRTGWREKKTDKEKAILFGELHQNGDLIALSSLRERKKEERKRKVCTSKNMRSPGCSAAQFFMATHLPIPPFLAKRVQREN